MQALEFMASFRRGTGKALLRAWWLSLALLLAACAEPWNNPYRPEEATANVLYGAFAERPKHLDPARAYSSNEYAFIGQIYEPPLAYHYLKRPYELVPNTARELPRVTLYDAQGRLLPDDAPPAQVAESVYEIRLRPGIRYQPHPALARDETGGWRYHDLRPEDLEHVHTLADFPETGTRELVAEDYVYQIKRLADPRVHSPIFGIMREYIVGLDALRAAIQAARAEGAGWVDLRRLPLAGVEVVDRYTYRIRVKGKYPQLKYWLAMPFFAPMPWEADRFYSQPGLAERNITLDWYPIGTGAYMLTENNPNLRMVLTRNPHFRDDRYPSEGAPGDAAAGLLADAGRRLPFIDRAVYSLERESIPYWNKFLQGYYDASGISSESFDQAVQIGAQGDIRLTPEMEARGIRLSTAVASSIFYLGFNMLDPVVGGLDERARKLRRAIAIAVDYEEFIAIFLNGRGVPAQGPIPPGIFGYREGKAGINPYVYRWEGGRPVRRTLEEARRLLAEAGYPGGVDERSGKPLTLYLDIAGGGPDDKARMDWFRKQFAKLGIQLVIRNTLYNRFQEKMRQGTAQLFLWGWNADYPDPENFLFLLYGPNSKARHGGENAANYANPEFDALFERMKNMDDGPERQALIDEMVDIVRRDGPWLWGLHPKRFTLYHAWYKNTKPNLMAHDTLKYLRIDPELRHRKRLEWNRPIVWPLGLAAALAVALVVPAWMAYRRRERQAPKGGAA